VHERDDEVYYILEGALEMEAGRDHFTAAAGALVVIPRKVPHKFRNSGTIPARALMIFLPGGFDDMLQQLREAEARGSLGEEERRQILRSWGITGLEEGPIE
jgi:mannose-6-phosphate isomerase-like protein (cupin superfamily)